MKTFLPISILLLLTLAMASCSNELELTAPWKDIPVVNGMLDITDTAQYIRVERAFLDPEKNALSFTKNIDSIYYHNATVSLRRLSTDQSYVLTRVDGNLEGFVRDTGIWAQAPNYLYKIKSDALDLVAGEEYQLIINKGDNLATTTATTQLVGIPTIILPSASSKLAISTKGKYALQWQSAEGAKIYDIKVTFHYQESSESNPNEFHNKSISWNAVSNIEPRSGVSVGVEVASFDGIQFFKWLQSTIPVKNVSRKYKGTDFTVLAGGREIKEYFAVSQANSGITGSETTTNYTNIPDGLGLYSSKAMAYRIGLTMTNSTLDTLKNGYLTKSLNFVE